MAAQSSLFGSSVVPFRLVFLMWATFYLELMLGIPLSAFGIEPRTFHGLIGIFTAPLIHGDLIHLISNTIPMLFLGCVLFFFYGKIGGQVFFRAYFWTNILVWLFARPANHIGASGVVYGLAFFLISFGFFRRDFLSIFISTIILLLYGGIFYGVLPTDPHISWESHFAGALVGITTAVTFSKQKSVN
ncbi:rhomboid family intramembrane serine protease [Ohtaekwangia sp.]|uniref:rhomboid family intramembrane serine protease n=1 Tax=Ohtaekwangia sp. TaxID=2066019 RepID=UPI002F94E326